MSHQYVVSLWHRAVVNSTIAQLSYRVDLYLFSFIYYSDTGMHQRINLYCFTISRLKDVNLVCIRRHRLFTVLPSNDATFQVDTLKAFVSHYSCSIGRTSSASAINGNRLILWQQLFHCCYEVPLCLVYVYSTSNMSFIIFLRCPDIQ